MGDSSEAWFLCSELERVRDELKSMDDKLTQLIFAACRAGVSVDEIARSSGRPRDDVVSCMEYEAKRRGYAPPKAVANVERIWLLDQVVRDRWDMSWRAVCGSSGEHEWLSADSRVSLTHAELAKRLPITLVPMDSPSQ